MKVQTSSDLARLLKNARVQRDLTQQNVADAVGITRQSLARLERGNGGASFDTVLLILDHLGVRLDAIADDDTTAHAAGATSSAAQVAAVALSKRLASATGPSALAVGSEASRSLTESLTIPGSVIIFPARTVEAGSSAATRTPADADPDTAGNTE